MSRFGDRTCSALIPPRLHRFLRVVVAAGRNLRHIHLGLRADSQPLAQLGIELGEYVLILLEERPGIFAALADTLAGVAIPGARLLHDVVRRGQIQDVALAADALAVEDVEFGLA